MASSVFSDEQESSLLRELSTLWPGCLERKKIAQRASIFKQVMGAYVIFPYKKRIVYYYLKNTSYSGRQSDANYARQINGV